MNEELSETLREAIKELYFWQYGDATNFTAKLYELIGKADPVNRMKLSLAFPYEVLAFKQWERAEVIEQFFKDAGVWPGCAD